MYNVEAVRSHKKTCVARMTFKLRKSTAVLLLMRALSGFKGKWEEGKKLHNCRHPSHHESFFQTKKNWRGSYTLIELSPYT